MKMGILIKGVSVLLIEVITKDFNHFNKKLFKEYPSSRLTYKSERLENEQLEYEVPGLTNEEIREMNEWFANSKVYVIER
jgi:hypothetical protein